MGNKVVIDYAASFDDGTVFDGSVQRGAPLEMELGRCMMPAPLEFAVSQMAEGEERRIHVDARDAYGLYDESLVERVPIASFPHADELPVGHYIVLGAPESALRVKVLKIEDGFVYFDHNHELAGQNLNFDVTVRKIVVENAMERELHPADCACGCHKLKDQLQHA